MPLIAHERWQWRGDSRVFRAAKENAWLNDSRGPVASHQGHARPLIPAFLRALEIRNRKRAGMRNVRPRLSGKFTISRNNDAASRAGSEEGAHRMRALRDFMRPGSVISSLFRKIMPVIIICTAAFALLPMGAANAADSHGYSKLWVFKSSSLGVCMDFEVSGTITYDTSVTFVKGNPEYHWSDVTLVKPVLFAQVYALKNGACSTTLVNHTTHMIMTQEWAGYSCSFNPSVSFGLPFSVGIGGWPSCGNRERAAYTFDAVVTHDNYLENNSGNQPLGDFSSEADSGPCYAVYIAAQAYVGATSAAANSGSYSVWFR